MKKLSATERARRFLASHPEATNRAVAEALSRHKVTRQAVANARRRPGTNGIKSNGPRPLVTKRVVDKWNPGDPPPLKMAIDLPPGGITLKLRNGGMLGTLRISQRGLKFKRANAKLTSDRELTWAALESLMKCGLL